MSCDSQKEEREKGQFEEKTGENVRTIKKQPLWENGTMTMNEGSEGRETGQRKRRASGEVVIKMKMTQGVRKKMGEGMKRSSNSKERKLLQRRKKKTDVNTSSGTEDEGSGSNLCYRFDHLRRGQVPGPAHRWPSHWAQEVERAWWTLSRRERTRLLFSF